LFTTSRSWTGVREDGLRFARRGRGCIAEEFEHAGHVLDEFAAHADRCCVRLRVVLVIGQRQPTLIQPRDRVGCVACILRRAIAPWCESVQSLELAKRAFQIFAGVDGRNAVEILLDGGRATPFYCGGVHAGRVVGPDFPLSRSGLGLSGLHVLGARFENVVKRCLVPVVQLLEGAKLRIGRGNLGSTQPATVREFVEVVARGACSVEIGTVEWRFLHRALCGDCDGENERKDDGRQSTKQCHGV
jgi:hypothetical protein